MSETGLSAKGEKPKRAKPSAPLMGAAEARAAMLRDLAALPAENVALERALGRVLAAPVTARRDQPPFRVSAMDGYAVKVADTPGRLRLTGEAAAGRGFEGVIGAGETVRISTGAAVPEGTDAVVIQENVLIHKEVGRDGDWIEVPHAAPDDNVRPRAMDFTAGRQLLDAGLKLDGVALALAAAAGAAELPVVRCPRVAILSGGDELAAPGTVPGPFQIFDSGSHGIAGLIESWGGRAERLPLEKDDIDSIARAAEKGLESDLLVLVGGASVGDHDHARPALKKLGLELMVEKVALRPGKPTWFGRVRGKPVLGLPGNPASALVCAYLFLKPMIAAILGRRADAAVRFVRARLEQGLPANGSREHYLRSFLSSGADGMLAVRAFEQQDSSLLSVFAAANALIRLAPDAPAFAAGALVDVLVLDR
ncbi:MAG TPA: gephyrin-like molybdotransferase Glp [Rhizomicrobium sp.]|nr:gephyrin-like molybdotransferase Glp [Rhizomicrobium sp.]